MEVIKKGEKLLKAFQVLYIYGHTSHKYTKLDLSSEERDMLLSLLKRVVSDIMDYARNL